MNPTSPAIVGLANLLVATLRGCSGCVGLSAPQIGENVRLFAMNASWHPDARSCAGLVVLANPKILARRGSAVVRERCASLPRLTGEVARAEEVMVSGFVPGSGKNVVLTTGGLEASCIQHEIDHLDGMLLLDRVVDPVADLFVDEDAG